MNKGNSFLLFDCSLFVSFHSCFSCYYVLCITYCYIVLLFDTVYCLVVYRSCSASETISQVMVKKLSDGNDFLFIFPQSKRASNTNLSKRFYICCLSILIFNTVIPFVILIQMHKCSFEATILLFHKLLYSRLLLVFIRFIFIAVDKIEANRQPRVWHF